MEGQSVEESAAVSTDQQQQTPEEAQSSIQAGYDKVAGIEPETEPTPTAETPPEKVGAKVDELADLREQVGRIPDLVKQLRDVNGRYGSLSQRFEEMTQRLAAPATSKDATAANIADASELLKDLADEYPELAEKLSPAFNRVLGSSGNGMSAEAIQKVIDEREEAKAKKRLEEAQTELSQAHPDWFTVRETDDYKEWLDSLTPRAKSRFLRSMDPDYVAEKLDDFKDWQVKKHAHPQSTEPTQTNTKSKDRLKNAITPTNGAATTPQVKSNKESILAGYERVAGKRM